MIHIEWIFSTFFEAKVKIKLPELNVTAYIFVPFHITNQNSNYNVIFGRDLFRELEISIGSKTFFGDGKEPRYTWNLLIVN